MALCYSWIRTLPFLYVWCFKDPKSINVTFTAHHGGVLVSWATESCNDGSWVSLDHIGYNRYGTGYAQSLGWSTEFKQRLFILVGGTQAFATPTVPAPQASQLSEPASPVSPTNPTTPPWPTIFTRVHTLQARIRRLIAWIRAEDERIWFFVTSLVCLCLWIRVSLPWHGSWLIFASSTWIGQIVRNVMRGSRRVFKKWVVLLMSCGRLAIPMCQYCSFLADSRR